MNRRQRRQRQRVQDQFRRQLQQYTKRLLDKGMEEREIARAVYYVRRYGFDAVHADNGMHVVFDEPQCKDGWECVNPEHQKTRRVSADEAREMKSVGDEESGSAATSPPSGLSDATKEAARNSEAPGSSLNEGER